MAEAIAFRFDATESDRVFDQLGKRAPAVIARVLNRTSVSARAVLARDIAGDMGLPVNVVRDELKIRPATFDDPSAVISASAKMIPLEKFRASGPLPSRGRGTVSARIGPTRKRYEGAFRAQMRSGHIGVFRRSAKGTTRKSPGAWGPNLPILELKGPSIWKVGVKQAESARARFNEQLVKNLEHEVGFALAQVAG